MPFKKRKKASRFRGSQTHKRGFKKKARGSGHRGGFGMAGTGKRGDQKKTLVLKLYGNDYFGRDKTLRRGRVAPKAPVFNLSKVSLNMDSFVEKGIAKQTKDGYDLDLSSYKILGILSDKLKLTITAKAASANAVESVEKAGGKIVLKNSEDSE